MASTVAMLVLPAPAQVDLDKVRAVLKAKEARRAREFEFAQLFADCDVGAMPPFGNLYGVPVYVEKSLAEDEEIAFNACTHSELIQLAYKDFARLVKPTVTSFKMQ